MLSNTAQGLHSTDHNLLNLFELYGASRWQTLIHLRLPNALPYFLAGLRIAGGLALIAAVVAEFAAGTAGEDSGLAFRLHRSAVPAEHPAPLRGAGAPLADRRRDLLRHQPASRTCFCGTGTRAP